MARTLPWNRRSALQRSAVDYVGSQPSIIRRSLLSLPDLSEFVFVDVGCGKGRALAVASEFPFQALIGVEYSESISRLAKCNSEIIAEAFPERKRIEIVTADASRFSAREYKSVVFFAYNPFKADLVSVWIDTIAARCALDPEFKSFVVYYNPVHYNLFDGSAAFCRYSAEKYWFLQGETGSSPFGNNYDSVIIYQTRGAKSSPPLPGAERFVRITVRDFGAEVLDE